MEHEHNIYSLCTCYTLDQLKRQAEAMAAGIELQGKNAEVEILEMIPDLSLDTLNEAINRYDEKEFKTVRDDWWAYSDREYDIQTLCLSYPLEILLKRRDDLLNGSAKEPDNEIDENDIIYHVEADVIEDAIACYNEENNIYSLCTCYTLDYLKRQAEAMAAGIELQGNTGMNILELIPDLSLDTLNEAINRYDEKEFKTVRDDWWVFSDREHDIQTLCLSYPLEILLKRRDDLLNGSAKGPDNEIDENDIIYHVEADVIEDAIACYNEEKYKRNRFI